MAWIESHQELGQHPKTKKAARLLGVSLPATIGHLHLLWWWALSYAQDGDLTGFEAGDLADAMLWDGDADALVNGLVTAGFLDLKPDGRLAIHDWADYTFTRLARKSWAAVADWLTPVVLARDDHQCVSCGADENLTVDHITPLSRGGSNELYNLQTLCRSCNSRKGAR